MNLEVLKKEIMKIYNIEKQICLNDFEKTRKFRKKWWSVCFYGFLGVFFVFILLPEYLQLCVCMCVSPVDTTSWQRFQYIAIRLKHNCNSCYSVCVCLVYVLCVYICNYISWYIYMCVCVCVFVCVCVCSETILTISHTVIH